MGVVLTIPLLFLRNLCLPDKTVTQHFQPKPSSGVTPLNLAKELYAEALAKRGLTAKASLIFRILTKNPNNLLGLWPESNKVDPTVWVAEDPKGRLQNQRQCPHIRLWS